MRWRGLEPPRPQWPLGPQPSASTNSATSAWIGIVARVLRPGPRSGRLSRMADDWRVTIAVGSTNDAHSVLRALKERDVHHELRDQLGGRVAVSNDGPNIFLYADTRRAAEAGERVLREVLEEHGLPGEPHLDRWHPIEERWEDASVPLPDTDEARDAERERLDEQDEEDSERTGIAQWEVRIELPSPQEAERLADRFEDEGLYVVRRSHYLLVGANDKDEADELARRLQAESPEGARVHVEPGSGLAWQLRPQNPFAVFGGLAG
jgi:hypothetical protein